MEVIDSRTTVASRVRSEHAVRRRRQCPNGHRATTYETFVEESVDAFLVTLEQRIEVLELFGIAVIARSQTDRWDAARLLMNLSQEHIDKQARQSSGAFSKYINGANSPTPETRGRVNEILKSEARELLDKLVRPRKRGAA